MQANYRELKIWRSAMDLVPRIYSVIAKLPVEESDNLKTQMRRAVTSLPLNIAEGACSKTARLYVSHLGYAYASAQELTCALMICHKVGYIDKDFFSEVFEHLDHFNRAIYKFLVNLEQNQVKEKFDF